jgi:hypothetical protein
LADLAFEISYIYGLDDGPDHPGANITIRYVVQVGGGWYRLHAENSSLGVWKHACFSVNIPSRTVTVFSNSFSVTSKPIQEIKNSTENLLNHWQDSHLWSMFDTVSQMNVFTTNISKVKCGDEGNLISWSSPHWSFDSRFPALARRKVDDKSKVCGEGTTTVIITIPVQPDFWGAVNLCRLLGDGEVTAYYSLSELVEAIAKAKEDVGPFSYLWSRFVKINDTFVDYYSRKNVTNKIVWRIGGTNLPSNCVYCHENGCVAKDCLLKLKANFQCIFQKRPILFLKGLCADSKLDRAYHPDTRMGEFMWIGIGGSFIKYNESSNGWVVKVRNTNTWAMVEARHDSLMLGTHEWIIHNDFNCFSKSTEKKRINLSYCSSSMFSCHDGNCTKIENRCNKNIDCPDGSDEKDCEVVLLPEYYDKVNGGHCGLKTKLLIFTF